MSGLACTTCGYQGHEAPVCDREDCPWPRSHAEFLPFVHVTPSPDACQHDFKDWRDDEDGRGGSLYCAKCGMSARHFSMMMSP